MDNDKIREWITRARDCRLAAENNPNYTRKLKLLNLANMYDSLATQEMKKQEQQGSKGPYSNSAT